MEYSNPPAAPGCACPPSASAPPPSAAAPSSSRPGATATWPRPPASSTSRSMRASTCSTPPTSIPRDCPRRSSARSSRGAATACSSRRRTFRLGEGPNDVGSSRYHLMRAVEASLRRLGTDVIDIYHLHGFDALHARRGGARHARRRSSAPARSATSLRRTSRGWHLMKSLAVAERYGWPRYVAHQAYYSLVGREYEWELMPLAVDQKVGDGGLESARLGPADRAKSAAASRCRRPAASEQARHRHRPAGPRRVPLRRRRCARRGRRGDRQDRPAGRPRTGCSGGRPWRASSSARATRSSSAEPRRRRLGADARAGREARRGKPRTPIYPYWHQLAVRRAESVPDGDRRRSRPAFASRASSDSRPGPSAGGSRR